MGGSLAVSFLSLGLVCLVAYLSLTWLARRMPQGRGAMKVLARQQLEPRRSLFVVKVADRTFLLGSAESGVNLVAELSAEEASQIHAATHVARQSVGASLWAAWQRRGVGAGVNPGTPSEPLPKGDS